MPTPKWLDLSYDVYDRYSAAQDEIHRLTMALVEINEPPDERDPVELLQAHWDIAAAALNPEHKGK